MFCAKCNRPYPEGNCPIHGFDGDNLRASLPPVEATPRAGENLNRRFVLRGVLGKGGMSGIYLAADTHVGGYVAVKMLEGDYADSERKRLKVEADATASIDHPNVVKLYGQFEAADGTPYLVTELLLGESLGDYLRRHGRMDAATALPLFIQAARGLQAAHDRGVVHRDVKPDNLFLLGPVDEPRGLKLIDFGLAKMKDSAQLTDAGTALGTMEYIPPEQFLTDPVDGRTDVYSLGMVLYKTLTGEHPFPARDNTSMLAHHLLSPPPFPSSRCEGLDPRLDEVVLTALKKDPNTRYQHVAEFGDDLQVIASGSDGELYATAFSYGPDEYAPRTRTAELAARYCYRRLGVKDPRRQG